MTPSLANPPRFRFSQQDGAHVVLDSDAGYSAHIFVLEEGIVRVALLRGLHFITARTWSIAAGEEEVPEDGRDRFDMSGFSAPPYAFTHSEDKVSLATSKLRVSIELNGLRCLWEIMTPKGWCAIARDRSTQAYNFGWWEPRVHHYLARNPSEKYFGLGERSGDMDRALRRFRLKGTDTMGYSAKTTDPLYKHIPFYITLDNGNAFGLFYDTYADCEFDFGQEISNYHGPYRSFVAHGGDLDYYVIAGPTVAEVTHQFTWLTGRPMLPPKWALGYSGSTMSYTDAPDAQSRMEEFIEKCRAHNILCDSFHLSSGYTSIGAQRHIFHWNREKFPDPAEFISRYHAAGIRLCANIKPWLLADNPLFREAREAGFLLCDANGEPAWTQLWSGLGVYVDFTNPAARRWWIERVKASLLEFGIDATWNDNNEFEILSPTTKAHGFDGPAAECKPLQTLMMIRSSRAAQREFDPHRRPFLVTRAGVAGMQRYAQTWSGDNYTSWETLRYNIKMGLGLALSGVSNSGHDVGGFAGPAPDAELFVRWVEAGIFMPRFSIHSWNSDNTVNEPWMHPEVTELVGKLIQFRYALLPYLYDLMWRYREHLEPVWRPAFYDFPDDLRCLEESDAHMLGASLLIAPVCAPDAQKLSVYLPKGSRWIDYWSGEPFAGGQTVEVDAPLGRPVLFVREGSAIPMNEAEQHFDARADARAFAVFPPERGQVTASCREDDGESEYWRDGAFGDWEISIDCADELAISCARTGADPPRAPTLTFLFHAREKRPVEVRKGTILRDVVEDEWRRVVVQMAE